MRVAAADDRERGAIAVMVALLAAVLFGSAAIAIDAGSLWSTRRTMVTVTDAAALAAAHKFVKSPSGGCADGAAYMTQNLASAQMTRCDYNTATHTVTFGAKTTASLMFARIWGQATRDVSSTTSVRWGPPRAMKGLRSIGICTKTPGLAAWDGYSPFSTTIYYNKAQPSNCGSGSFVSGNWGTLNLSNRTPDTDPSCTASAPKNPKDWVVDGYPCMISTPVDIGADTGSVPGLDIGRLLNKTFYVPLYDSVNLRSGNNVVFHVVGFAAVILREIVDTGKNDDRYIKLDFTSGVTQGECCGDPGISNPGLYVVKICATDPNTSCP
jgi:hypothetical protein